MILRREGTPIDEYVSELRAELSVLGEDNVDEIAAEVRSHLDEAAAEGPSELARYMAEAGTPAEFALAILRERGLLPQPLRVPDAPMPRRLLANAVDTICAAAIVAIFSTGPIQSTVRIMRGFDVRPGDVILAWVMVLLAVLGVIFYFRSRRSDTHYPSPGFRLASLVRVRGEQGSRVVAQEDVRGRGGQRGRVWAVLQAALALAILAGTPATLRRTGPNPGLDGFEIAVGVDVSTFDSRASLFYRDLLAGKDADALAVYVLPEAREEMERFVAESRAAGIDGYSLAGNGGTIEYEGVEWRPALDAQADLDVTVFEAHPNRDGTSTQVELHMRKVITRLDDNSWETEYYITGFDRVGEIEW